MANLENHSARCRRVDQFNGVAEPPQTHPLDRRGLRLVETNRASHERDSNLARRFGFLARLLRHDCYPLSRVAASSSVCWSLPRSCRTVPGSFNRMRPANVARTTLCELAEPIDLVRTFWIPHDSTTARTAPPAMIPVPSGAGFSSTWPAPNRPRTGCGTVVPASGTRISDFFAASMPFLIADGTSFALPTPNPTIPWPSPTTTSALKLRFLPPFTTFVTRLIETTVSLISSCEGRSEERRVGKECR